MMVILFSGWGDWEGVGNAIWILKASRWNVSYAFPFFLMLVTNRDDFRLLL